MTLLQRRPNGSRNDLFVYGMRHHGLVVSGYHKPMVLKRQGRVMRGGKEKELASW
jgi:hypothetical protein